MSENENNMEFENNIGIGDRNWKAKCALYKALAIAQGQIGAAGKDGTNPHFKSNYSTLASIQAVIQDPLSKNGLCFFHEIAQDVANKTISLNCIIAHNEGGSISCAMTAITPDLSPQKLGSAETYLRRYTLLAILGIATEDDDGNAAQGFDNNYQQRQPQQRPVRNSTEIVAPKTATTETKTAPIKQDAPAAVKKTATEKPDDWNELNWSAYKLARLAFDVPTKKDSLKRIHATHAIETWESYKTIEGDNLTAITQALAELIK